MTTILSARNVTKAFGDNTVLHGISVDIAAGDMVAITCLLYTSDAADE